MKGFYEITSPLKRRHRYVVSSSVVRNVAGIVMAVLLVAAILLINVIKWHHRHDDPLLNAKFFKDFAEQDQVLKVFLARQLTHVKAMTALPPSCDREMARQISAAFQHFNPKTTIIVMPNHPHDTLNDYKLTLSSIVQTTYHLASKLEILLVTNKHTQTDEHRQLFDQLERSNSFIFRQVPLKLESTTTMFRDMVEASQSARGELLVFLQSGQECSLAWLEHLLWPIVRSQSDGSNAFIVAPHFDSLVQPNSNNNTLIYARQNDFEQLHVSVDMKPQWLQPFLQVYPEKWQIPNEHLSPVLLPDAFAVNRHSHGWLAFVELVNERRLADVTSFDLAQFAWRCLSNSDNRPGYVIVSSCSRIASPNHYASLELDPRLNDATKLRLINTWLDNPKHRELAREKLDLKMEDDEIENFSPNCRSFSDFLELTGGNKKLFKLGRFVTGRLHSLGMVCFAGSSENQYVVGTPCDGPFSKSNFFLHQENGVISLLDGRCLTMFEKKGYITLEKCDPTEVHQKWRRNDLGAFESMAHSDRCLSQAIDPDENEPRQILSSTRCSKIEQDHWWALFAFSSSL